MSVAEWLALRVDVQGDCWLWIGPPSSEGYGRVHFDGGERKAHRHVYEVLVAPIPDGLHLDHLCRVRHCVNPDHLEPVQPRVNYLRGVGPTAVNARKSICAHGHAFTVENTVLLSGGRRRCRTCQREMDRVHKAAKRRKAS